MALTVFFWSDMPQLPDEVVHVVAGRSGVILFCPDCSSH